MTPDHVLQERKQRLIKRMKDRGLSEIGIKHLPYLDFDESEFTTAHKVGARMVIRHKVLNWVRGFSEDRDWDETDTST